MRHIALLRKLDSKDEWLHPRGFDKKAKMDSIAAFVNLIEDRLNRNFLIKSDVEDATFFAEVVLNEEKVKGHIYQTVVRFSNFGNLVTINNPSYDPEECKTIEGILEGSGFDYIPIELLENDYDGLLPDKSRISTWKIRFFDYI